MSDIDTLLDSNLDDLADLPEFALFKVGTHRVTINFVKKEVNKHPAVEAKMKLVETVELADTSEEPDAPGMESSVAYMLDNEYGQGNLKKILIPLGQHLGLGKLSEILDQANGMEVIVTTQQRENKDKTAKYLGIVSLQVE